MSNEELMIDRAVEIDREAAREESKKVHRHGGIMGVACGIRGGLRIRSADDWGLVTCDNCLKVGRTDPAWRYSYQTEIQIDAQEDRANDYD